MISIYQYKSQFQGYLRPLVNQFAKRQITPNQVTIAALLLSSLTGLALVQSTQWAITALPSTQVVLLSVPLVLLGRMALNAIDGMLAREQERTTKLGCILNELSDVLSDVALYLPFSLLAGVSAPLIVGFIILAIVSEMTGVLGYAIDDRRHYEGPMGKSDRAAVFGTLGLLLGLGVAPAQWLSILLSIVLCLQIWTTIERIQGMLKEVEAWN